MSESYGQKIVRLRTERGWTQKHLSELSGVPLRTLQNVEGDKAAKPQRATVLAINSVFEIEGDPEETRSQWPRDVQVYLDIMGAFLANMPEQRRMHVMREITRHVVGAD